MGSQTPGTLHMAQVSPRANGGKCQWGLGVEDRRWGWSGDTVEGVAPLLTFGGSGL